MLANVLKRARAGVADLDIASDVSVTVDLGELTEGLVCDAGNVQLVVTNGQHIVVDVLENGVRNLAIDTSAVRVGGNTSGVAEACTIVQILILSTSFRRE